ncbi:glycoside hydrolase [Streptomyces sp. NPDC002055]|uniref:glycoside hydrolase n=1 Tax=Streptomyces sp. NPDC002055 TaxID=3154534 RepID=UPI00331B25A6
MPSTTAQHGRPRRRRAVPAVAVVTVVAATAACWTAAAGPSESPRVRVHGDLVDIPVKGGTATVDTTTLRVDARTDRGRLRLSAPSATAPGAPGRVTATGAGARWTYPEKGLTVTARPERGRLLMTVRAARDTELSWPVTGTDRSVSAVQFPRGEGLSVPVADRFWNSAASELPGSEVEMDSGLTMPLWGYTAAGGQGVSYLTPTDIGTTLRFVSRGGRLHTTSTHHFSRAADTRSYTVALSLTDGSPVAPAVDYRNWLSEHGQLGSLRRKIDENPAARKLLGAFYSYGWGEARRKAGVERLRALGVSRMWLGYDADRSPMDAAAVRAARKAGYLVGPYDSFANGQDPKSSDAPTSVWPGRVYPDFCVTKADGTPQSGFHDRGCYLSSQAFEQAEGARHYLADRTRSMVANGSDSYFLDVDAAGELFRDHSARHPMTKAQDRANRIARMKRLSDGRKLVLGSESAGAWANEVLAFDHGSGTPVSDGLWAVQRDKQNWGGYVPANAPATFFKPAKLPAALAKAMYDPAYRVPLYETALHSSVVNAERWELSFDKLPEQKSTRALLAMLYNTPLNFVLDGPSLERNGKELAALQKYFAPLHRAAGTERMTSFRYLTDDHRVQRTVFGDGTLTVTANFGTKQHAGLPGGCVDARLRGDDAPRRLCPRDVVS